jgi:SAM-dependent methyltransferase
MPSVTSPFAPTDLAFEEIDLEGECTLETLAGAARFNRWMFETIAPYCTSPVLEVGSGIGNISSCLLDAGFTAHLSDVRPRYCRRLRSAFGTHPGCLGVHHLDLVHPDFEHAYAPLLGRFGTVFALNVIEHIAADRRAVANCRRLLRPGGNLIVLVPAWSWLYNRLDRELGHFRRYNRRTLEQVLAEAGSLDVVRTFSFNLAGTLGWFVSGTLLRNRTPPASLVNLYDRLVWLFRVIDRLTGQRAGLSVITVARARDCGLRSADCGVKDSSRHPLVES